MKRIGERAVVIGASMAGLLAARALSDFYGTVTVLERDAFPVSDIPRKGVPQGRHAHGLLARGRSVIERFFPGWTDEVVAAGGIRGDIAGDVHWIGHGVTIRSAPSDLVWLLASRPVLEGHVRRRLLGLPNVRAVENCAVQGLIASEDRSAIKGVRARIGNIEQIIDADLVVDASGRGSSSPVWLQSLGYAPPAEEKIEIGIGYTTRTYRRRPGDLNGKLAVVVAGSGPNWRNGVVLYQTDDSWIVSIGGFFGDHAADDDLLDVADLDAHALDRRTVVAGEEALHSAILDGAHVAKREQPAPHMAFEHRARCQQPDQVAGRALDGDAMADPVHVAGDVAADAAGGDHLVGPAGKEALDHAAAAGEQAVRMAPLRHALARQVGDGKGIALQHGDRAVEISQRAGGQQPCHTAADDNRPLADPLHG